VTKPKIAIIISTTRATRFGEKAAKWIHAIAVARTDMSVVARAVPGENRQLQ